jgi:uncharacterized protein (TIGR01370 family)
MRALDEWVRDAARYVLMCAAAAVLGGTAHELFAAASNGTRSSAKPAHAQVSSVALFYGAPLPVEALSQFDWVVVEPGNAAPAEVAALSRANVRVFAYLSVGEARADEAVNPQWVLGKDEVWNTSVMDPAARGWRDRILSKADALEKQGYTGLFLDTLDSYAKALPSPAARQARVKGLVSLGRALRRKHPGLLLFFNRGFEILDEAGELADAIAAESVFVGWDQARQRYMDVPEADRAWLVQRLQGIRTRLGIPVVAIDYLPPSRSAEAPAVIRRLETLGFIPWISTPELDQIGFGAGFGKDVSPAPPPAFEFGISRLLLLYDSAESASLEHSLIARLAAPQAQALGFKVDLVDVRSGLTPDLRSAGYYGVISWFTDDDLPSALDYPGWLSRQIAAGARLVILGRPGFPAKADFLQALGLIETPDSSGPLSSVTERGEVISREVKLRLRNRGLLRWQARAPDVRTQLRIADERGASIDPVVTARWGGLALDPYLVESGYQGSTRWIVDPRAFLATALAIPGAFEAQSTPGRTEQ